MRRVVMALPLAVALAIGTAPIAFADSPTPVDLVIPEDASVCAGTVAEDVASVTVQIERTATDLQLSDGATVHINVLVELLSENGTTSLLTLGDAEVTLPADWTSQPEGTLSEGVAYSVSLMGDQPGTVPPVPINVEVFEVGSEPLVFQEFEGSIGGFEVLDCSATPAPPAPAPTIAPTDAAGAPTGGRDQSGVALVLVALSAIALMVAHARRRRPQANS